MIAALLDILSYRRPHLSHSLRECAEAHVIPLGAVPDSYGNLILDIGEAPHILWSAHLDTVHTVAGRQRIYANGKRIMTLPGRKGFLPNCLGADDGVGIWLLCEMVKAGIAGRYVWHQNEEHGGLGSSHIVDTRSAVLDGITIAMAFDRRGTQDVITHQFGGRTASDAFALSFATALDKAGLGGYRPEHGIFTDTANYADTLPECSNLSCGYANEHHTNEVVDVVHVLKLRDALCVLDTSALVVSRKPGEDDWHSYPLSHPVWYRRDDDEVPNADYPFDKSRVWLQESLTNITHCLRYDHDSSGKTLCGDYADTGDYWCVDDTWTPEEFCASCLDIEAEEYEDWEKVESMFPDIKEK